MAFAHAISVVLRPTYALTKTERLSAIVVRHHDLIKIRVKGESGLLLLSLPSLPNAFS